MADIVNSIYNIHRLSKILTNTGLKKGRYICAKCRCSVYFRNEGYTAYTVCFLRSQIWIYKCAWPICTLYTLIRWQLQNSIDSAQFTLTKWGAKLLIMPSPWYRKYHESPNDSPNQFSIPNATTFMPQGSKWYHIVNTCLIYKYMLTFNVYCVLSPSAGVPKGPRLSHSNLTFLVS